MTISRLLVALALAVALPSAAVAQDAGQDQTQGSQADQTNAPADPVRTLQGLWHVDHVEGSAARDTMTGNLLKIDPQAITSLSGGTCAGPSFASSTGAADPKQMGVDITCLGQVFASAHWNTDDPNTVDWREPGLDVTLHRVTSAAAEPSADQNTGAGAAQ